MTHINSVGQWSKIAWVQDAHGQWSSGSLRIQPIVHKHGPVAWQIWLNDECIGRPLGYHSPALARMAASQMAIVRRVAHGHTVKSREEELRQAGVDLYVLCERICRQDDRIKRQELVAHATRIARAAGIRTGSILREQEK
jgi:hypothetical protein